jgi:hypothetical protein
MRMPDLRQLAFESELRHFAIPAGPAAAAGQDADAPAAVE